MEKYVVLFCIAALSAWKMHEAMRRNRHTRAILWLLSLALALCLLSAFLLDGVELVPVQPRR